MSAGRIFPVVVIVFWLGSMAWLIQTKVIRLMSGANAPIAHILPEVGAEEPIRDRWTIHWNDRRIGSVQSTAQRDASHGQIDVIVSLDDAPANEMLSEFFGPANHLIKLATRDYQTNSLNLRLTSSMILDYSGHLESFTSQVYFGGIGNLFQLDGQTSQSTLTIDVNAVGDFWPESFPRKLLTRDFELPNGAFVSDAFAPPAELVNLSVGRQWQYHAYRTLSPNQPLQQVSAMVEAVENIGWQGKMESVFIVALRNIGSDLSVADEQIGKMWVRSDGIVLKQTLRFGNLEVVFQRDESQHDQAAIATTSRRTVRFIIPRNSGLLDADADRDSPRHATTVQGVKELDAVE